MGLILRIEPSVKICNLDKEKGAAGATTLLWVLLSAVVGYLWYTFVLCMLVHGGWRMGEFGYLLGIYTLVRDI